MFQHSKGNFISPRRHVISSIQQVPFTFPIMTVNLMLSSIWNSSSNNLKCKYLVVVYDNGTIEGLFRACKVQPRVGNQPRFRNWSSDSLMWASIMICRFWQTEKWSSRLCILNLQCTWNHCKEFHKSELNFREPFDWQNKLEPVIN